MRTIQNIISDLNTTNNKIQVKESIISETNNEVIELKHSRKKLVNEAVALKATVEELNQVMKLAGYSKRQRHNHRLWLEYGTPTLNEAIAKDKEFQAKRVTRKNDTKEAQTEARETNKVIKEEIKTAQNAQTEKCTLSQDEVPTVKEDTKIVTKEDTKIVTKEVTKIVTKEDTQIVTKEDTQIVAKYTAKRSDKRLLVESTKEISKLLTEHGLSDDDILAYLNTVGQTKAKKLHKARKAKELTEHEAKKLAFKAQHKYDSMINEIAIFSRAFLSYERKNHDLGSKLDYRTKQTVDTIMKFIGVTEYATMLDVSLFKKAYRAKAKELHPDLAVDFEESTIQMQHLNEFVATMKTIHKRIA